MKTAKGNKATTKERTMNEQRRKWLKQTGRMIENKRNFVFAQMFLAVSSTATYYFR